MPGSRSFTIESSAVRVKGGRYMSDAPGSAAKKAARRLFKDGGKKKKSIAFVLRETTQGSDKTEFKYVASRTKLAKPREIRRGDTVIVVEYAYTVKAA